MAVHPASRAGRNDAEPVGAARAGRSGLSIAIDRMPDKEQKIVFVRMREFEESMTRVLAAIKALAEQA